MPVEDISAYCYHRYENRLRNLRNCFRIYENYFRRFSNKSPAKKKSAELHNRNSADNLKQIRIIISIHQNSNFNVAPT